MKNCKFAYFLAIIILEFALLARAAPQSATGSTTQLAQPSLEYVPLQNDISATKSEDRLYKQIPKAEAMNVQQDAAYWTKIALDYLSKIVKNTKKSRDYGYKRKAKNIIIFIGDGMGLSTVTAGRIYKGQYLKHGLGEEEELSFDRFTHTGLAKTYNVNKQVPDSAGTATALFCGSKSDYGTICMDATRSPTDNTTGRLTSIMDWAQAEGKRTGIVTTTRITDATPAATYANVYNRNWECDSQIPAASVGKYKDIARQLVEDAPGNKFNVIMGGGLSPMGAFNKHETRRVKFEGDIEKVCKRNDGLNLVEKWLKLDETEDGSNSRVFVSSVDQLKELDLKNVDHLLGLFRNNHITYALAKEPGEPSLKEMTEAALRVLERGSSSKGYVLMVEGGRIDHGHHQNYAHAALHELYEFDQAIEAAVDMTDEDETLILVTADHSHAVTLNGYPTRGSGILGFANESTDGLVYETISYANGPGYYDHLANETRDPNSSLVWIPLETFTEKARMSPTYRHIATLPLQDETHGGEDVGVYAHGPGATLVRGVFEQHYLSYVMSYVGCIGPAKNFDKTCSTKMAGGHHHNSGRIKTASLSSLLLVLALAMLS